MFSFQFPWFFLQTNGSSKTGGVGGGGGGLGVVNGNMSNSEGQLLVAENTDVINNGTSNNNHVNSTNGGNSADPSTAGTSPRGNSFFSQFFLYDFKRLKLGHSSKLLNSISGKISFVKQSSNS